MLLLHSKLQKSKGEKHNQCYFKMKQALYYCWHDSSRKKCSDMSSLPVDAAVLRRFKAPDHFHIT